MLKYSYNLNVIQIKEVPNGDDCEFQIKILQESPYLEGIKNVQRVFEENKVYTDVLFYAYENHRYKIIVRKDYYVPFMLELMKQRLLTKLEWMA